VRLALAAALLAAGTCAAAPTLEGDVQPLLDAYCVSCHLLESAQGGLVLEAGESHAALVGVPSTQAPMPRVMPGDPARSYLVHKLRGTHLTVGGSVARMPFASEGPGVQLAPQDLETIEGWIRADAPE
jgi:hypothetical protein